MWSCVSQRLCAITFSLGTDLSDKSPRINSLDRRLRQDYEEILARRASFIQQSIRVLKAKPTEQGLSACWGMSPGVPHGCTVARFLLVTGEGPASYRARVKGRDPECASQIPGFVIEKRREVCFLALENLLVLEQNTCDARDSETSSDFSGRKGL